MSTPSSPSPSAADLAKAVADAAAAHQAATQAYAQALGLPICSRCGKGIGQNTSSAWDGPRCNACASARA